MNTDELLKRNDAVTKSFSKASASYHSEASVQKKVAEGLIASLKPWKEIIPEGPVLEIGCGTGFLSELIAREFPDRELIISDASEKMLNQARAKLTGNTLIKFKKFDAEVYDYEQGCYSLICSNFTAQWFKNTVDTLVNLIRALKPGGLLLMTFPGNKSFPEWWEHCLELGLPFTANTLPDTEELVIKLSLEPVQVDFYEDTITQNFKSSINFFRHLKKIGASVNTSGKSLTTKQLKLLIKHWDESTEGQITVSWHTVYLAVKKDV